SHTGRESPTCSKRGEFVSTERKSFSIGSVLLISGVVLATVVMLPATAIGQTTTTPSGPTLTLSSTSGTAGSTTTANGSGFQPSETVDVTFNGQAVGEPTVNAQGTWSLSFK